MNISKVAFELERFIIGERKPKDHWKKYRLKRKKNKKT